MSNNLFILDGQTDEVLGHINKKYVIDNEHEKDLPSHKDYFRFTVLDDNKHAEHLNKRNGLIVPGEDGELLEFRIFESIKYRNNEGLFIEVHALATYLDLKNQKIFDPHKTNSETALQHANLALAGTEWQVGEIDFKGIRTLTFDNPFNSYDYILRIAREFELEPRFYIKTDGNKITGRYVDLIERIGEFRGRTIELGRDLQRIERKEDTSEVVTALWIYGPQREDGSRLKVFVEDDEARQRWGRRGQHIIDYYEPQTENQDITEERLKTLGEMELRKRINAVVTYEAEILDLENVPGMENKKIRFGDTIRIKDTKFNPPLYVEARVFNVKRDVFNKSKKTVQLGDYREYTDEEVQAIWKLLQQQIQQKISAVQAEQMIEEYAEPKKVESPTPPPIDSEGDNPIWIDTSKNPHVPHIVEQGQWVKVVPTEAEEVNAYNKSEIDTITSELEDGIQQAMDTADGKNTVFRQSSTPPTTNRKIGDLWFKTNEGNKMFVWTGSAWTETKLDYQALSVGKLSAISADLGNVTAGHISGVTMNLANDKFIVDEQGNAELRGVINVRDSEAEYTSVYIDDKSFVRTSLEEVEIGIWTVLWSETSINTSIFTEYYAKSPPAGIHNMIPVGYYELGIQGLKISSSLDNIDDPPREVYYKINGISYSPAFLNDEFILDMDEARFTGNLSISGQVKSQAHDFLSLINNWQNYGGEYANLTFTKNADGFVHLRGVIRSGKTGNFGCARLPAGSRPFRREIFTVLTNNKIGRIDITPDGWIWMTNVDNTWVSLSGVSFRAEN